MIFISLTVSVNAETVGVSYMSENDTVISDSLAHFTKSQDVANDVKMKKPSWFKRAYLFMDRVLSPPRDTNYVDTQDNYNWCAEVQVTSRFEMYQVDAGDKFNLRVSPKVRTRVGPFFGWRFAFFGYNIDLKSVFLNKDDIDLGASIYSAAFGLDLFYRRVGGNYNVNSLDVNGKDYSYLLMGEPFDGINLGMTRISFYYVLNYKRFSHQAAYSQANRQLKSAGSTILGVSYAHNRMTLDWEKLSNKINSNDLNVDFNSNTLYGMQKNDEISLTAGYAYNWVFSKNWLLGSELTASLGYLLQHIHSKDKVEEDTESETIFKTLENFSKKNIAFNGTMRFCLLYNNGPWFVGTQAYLFYYQHGNGVMMTRNLLGTAYVYVGFNF